MRDTGKTKGQLINELAEMRQRIAGLEVTEAKYKRLGKALEERDGEFNDLFENALDLVQSVAPDGHFVYVNRAWRETLGYTQKEIRKLSVFDIIHPDSKAHCMEKFQEVLSGKSVEEVEATFVTKNGKKIIVEGSANCRFVDGKPVSTRGIFRNITQHKQHEELAKALSDCSPIGVYVVQDGKFQFVNPRFQELIGYSEDELLGMNSLRLVLSEDRNTVKENAVAMLKSQRFTPYEYRVVNKAGETRWIVETVTSIQYHGKRAALGNYMDITERKRTEKEIDRQKKKLESIMDSMVDGVTLVDMQGRITEVNRAITTQHGYRKEEIIGKTPAELFIAKRDHQKFYQCLKSMLSGKPVEPFDFLSKRKDGTEFPTEVNLSVLRDLEDKPSTIIAVHRDITERRRAEQQIKASLAEKELLLKEVHHRVKNNMQIISSLLGLQANGIEDNKARELLEESQTRIRSMALVYNKLYQSTDLANIDLRDYVSELTSDLVKSYASVSGRIVKKIEGDSILLAIDLAIPCGLCINELVTNSLKYAFPNGTGGEINVALSETDENEIEIIVSDNGVGIPNNVDLANTKTLGLYLVTMLVENQLGGKLELDGSQGTKFRITFNKNQ